MLILFFVVGAVFSYLVGGINPAIILSNAIYHKDIRTLGSKNPGFTNFKRVFGGKTAWAVFILDIIKTVVPVLTISVVFGYYFESRQLGAAYAGFFTMLGHAYPPYYSFKGGKCFVAGATAIFFVDWRVGLIAAAVFLAILFTVRYMSVASITAAILCPVMLAIVGFSTPWVEVLSVMSALLLIYRHRMNISRLIHKTESKTFLFGKKTA